VTAAAAGLPAIYNIIIYICMAGLPAYIYSLSLYIYMYMYIYIYVSHIILHY
jgi:hypothetical protein